MRFALINPNWHYDGSIYFGCRFPHLPLELGYGKAILERAGHEVLLIDGHLFGLDPEAIGSQVKDFAPDFTVITTAPTYLFWRCPPPELSVPMALAAALRTNNSTMVAVGPHGSVTPRSVLAKLGVHLVLRGEFEELLPQLAAEEWRQFPATHCLTRPEVFFHHIGEASFQDFPPLAWPDSWIRQCSHHHHRFDGPPQGWGAEVEASRGCPFHCSFCARDYFRGRYRRRHTESVLGEIDLLLGQGVEYVYFIDETFFPDRPLLEALAARPLKFGIQTRIDLWNEETLTLLGAAGCVSIEAGVESVTAAGRARLAKACSLADAELFARLVAAKRHVPFVQANLMRNGADDSLVVNSWRKRLQAAGVWANDPVPQFCYPGSADYRRRWGMPDDQAWERAHAAYLAENKYLCNLQESVPLALAALEGR